MLIAALKENIINEKRVSLTPDSVKIFKRLNLEVLIEDGAGINSGYPNELYIENGAKIVSRKECLNADICLCVKMPKETDLSVLKNGVGVTNTKKRLGIIYGDKGEFEISEDEGKVIATIKIDYS